MRAIHVVDRIWDQHAELAGKYGDAEMAEFASILCSILSKKSNDELESEIEGAFKYNKGSFKFTHRMCHNLCTAISYKLGLDYPEDYDEAKEVLLKKRDECLNEALIYAPFAHDNRMGYLFHLWDTTIRWPEKFRYKDTSRMIFLYQLGAALMLYSPEPGLELDEIRGKGADRKEIAESVRTTIRKHLAFLEKYKPLKDEADMEEIRELRKRMLEQKSQNS